MGFLHRIGKFYTRVIMNNIGIFIFIGLLSVVFGDCGWFPNEDIYAFSELVYRIILPTMIAFECGRKTGGKNGGIPAVLAMAGILVLNPSVGIFGAMLIGPPAGVVWKQVEQALEKRTDFRLKMLVNNLSLAVTGGVLAILVYFLLNPALEVLTDTVYAGIQFLVVHRMMGLLSVVIEPAKVLFLNNLMNHAVLVPLGMEQISQNGSSILFLLEANPGPGFGVLLALYLSGKEKRSAYGSAMFAQAVGGIHEVYFPFVLSDLRLLFPLILGGTAGNLCFQYLGDGVQGMISPGSILIVLLMAGKESFWQVFLGTAVSALVSFVFGMLILKIGTAGEHTGEEQKQVEQKQVEQKRVEQKKEERTEEKGEVLPEKRMAFVCDGGFGSSVMGAALMRRLLGQRGIRGIRVEAFAADAVPEDVDIIICQKDFYPMLPKKLLDREIHLVDDLVQTAGFEAVIGQLQNSRAGGGYTEKRNG